MAVLFLELYQGKIPAPFDNLAGAANYDTARRELYWAVLIPRPEVGSSAAAFIAPVAGGAPVTGATHGTDTLSQDATGFAPTRVGVWRPKEPPYGFKIITPSGAEVTLDPPPPGDEPLFHEVSAPAGEAVGVWVVEVFLLDANALPTEFPPRNARLNPDLLNLTGNFARQPLLRIEGNEQQRGGRCSEVVSVVVVSGCAPGTVAFEATISEPGEVEGLTWSFGDGTDQDGTVDALGSAQATHTYLSAGTAEDPLRATVTVLRHVNCSPRMKSRDVVVPPCPAAPQDECPELLSVVLLGRSRCAPGVVQFLATATNADLIEAWTWNFDDADGDVDGGAEMTHPFVERRVHDVTVTILRPQHCETRTQTLEVEVPACPAPPPPLRCAELSGIVVAGCAPGLVTLTAQGTDLTQGNDYTWDFGAGQTMTNGPSVTHEYATPGPHTVSVTVVRPNPCRPRTRSRTTTVPACPPPPPPPPPDMCLFWLVIMMILFAVAAVATVVAACLWAAILTPAFWTALGIAIGTFAAGLLIFILWMIFCAWGDRRCDLLRILVYFLRIMVGLSIGVAAILALLTQWFCLAGAGIDVVWFGVLLLVAEAVAEARGCALWAGAVAGARRTR